MKSPADLLREVKASIREVTPQEAERLRAAGATLVDVREQYEWDAGYIPGAVHVPRSYLEQNIETLVPDPSTNVVIYCAGGTRSAYAAQTLGQLGYRDVVSMSGGFDQWKGLGYPWVSPLALTPVQQQRYSRHLLIPEVGSTGQVKLLESKVLLVGAGGLGSPAALYLAAAGVGTLGIIDFDVVEISNLQRQVIHSTDRLGDKKVDSARRTIEGLNPDVKVDGYEEALTGGNV